MTTATTKDRVIARCFQLILLGAIAFVLTRTYFGWQLMPETIVSNGNDDIMRMVVVRDWLTGQGWFDNVQRRVVPPAGLELHWSRYVDTAIALTSLPFMAVMPFDQALLAGAALWPGLVLLMMVGVAGFGMRSVFGPVAGCFAALAVLLMPVTGNLHTLPGSVDHHSVQMLLMMVITIATLSDHRPLAAGVVSGFAAAMSLAIGLESVLFVVLIGVVSVLRTAFAANDIPQRHLLGFCGALAVFSVALWLGQTSPARLGELGCDRLAIPVLLLVAIAASASLLPLLAMKPAHRPAPYLASVAGLTFAGFVLAWPVLSLCLEGPYGALPPELRAQIYGQIVEARPVWEWLAPRVRGGLVYLWPSFAALAISALYWSAGRGKPDNNHFGLLVLIAVLASLLLGYQMRTITMIGSIVPLLAGVLLARQLDRYFAQRNATRAMAMLFTIACLFLPHVVLGPAMRWLPAPIVQTTSLLQDCRTHKALDSLNAVPAGVILAHGNLGTPIVWVTHHSVLAAPYHTSAQAFGNMFNSLTLEEPALRQAMLDQGADYLLLCKDYIHAHAYLDALASGAESDWLRPVPLANEDLVLLARQ